MYKLITIIYGNNNYSNVNPVIYVAKKIMQFCPFDKKFISAK